MQVIEPDYRSARVLRSDQFVTTLDQHVQTALDSVAALVCTDAASLTARLDKVSTMQAEAASVAQPGG